MEFIPKNLNKEQIDKIISDFNSEKWIILKSDNDESTEVNSILGTYFRVPFKTPIKIGEIVTANLYVGEHEITLAMSKEAYNELLKGTKVDTK